MKLGWLKRLDDCLAEVALVAIVVITLVGVFMRYVVGHPLVWTQEASVLLLVWFTFLGASSVMRNDEHISIDFIVNKFFWRWKRAFYVFRVLVIGVALIFMTILGAQLIGPAAGRLTPALKIPFSYIDLAIPVGGVFMLIHLISNLRTELLKKGSEKKTAE